MRHARHALFVAILVSVGCGGASSPHATPAVKASCTSNPVILHVASLPAERGATFRYENLATYSFATPKSKVKGTSHFSTAETVVSVDHDVIEDLEVKFLEGTFQPDDTKPAVDVGGKTFHVRREGDDNVFYDGQARASDELDDALSSYKRNDVGFPHFLVRLLTDSTFKQGEETHLTPESAIGSGLKPVEARITLQKVEGDRATFGFELQELSSGAPLMIHGTAVLDTAHARLISVDETAELDPSKMRASGFELSVSAKERFDYGAAATAAAATATTCEARTTLHIPWNPPRVGETFSFEQTFVADWQFLNSKTKASSRVRGGWDTATDERVLAVEDGVITALEMNVRKAIVRPTTVGDDEAKPISRAGDKIEIRAADGKVEVKRDGVVIEPFKDEATSVLFRADVARRFWLTRLVTDRTFELGVESRYPNEHIDALTDKSTDVRILLSSIDGNVARFKLDMKAPIQVDEKTVQLFMRGDLDFDIKLARPVRLSLAGDFDLSDVVEKTGLYTLEYRFQYPAASP